MNVLCMKPDAASEARPEANKPRGHRSRGFLASGLAEDAAEGLPKENPKAGRLQTLPRDSPRTQGTSSGKFF